jgi:DNA processing protein
MSPLEALVALNLLPKIGPVRVRRLLDLFGSPEAILSAPHDRLLRVDGIGEETAGILRSWQDHADPVAEIAEAAGRGIRLVTQDDPDYPAPLLEIYDHPLLLYVWGELAARDRHAISVVGSRRATTYGTHTTKKFSYQLAQAGFTIISGLARGIDTAAHEAAVAAHGRTIAVIGSGLAKLYPPENFGLAERIADGHGAVVSEFPLHTAPDKQTFPMRNRIVAGWARALLVVECPAWSGSLITANLATEYGKPVFAVPGQIDKPSSAGCHQLIREGATLVADPSHLLDDLGELPFERPAAGTTATPVSDLPELPADEAAVYAAVGPDELAVDRIIERCGLPAHVVTATLMKLEMRRLVRAFPGFRYARR